jgi:hypothetical protein
LTIVDELEKIALKYAKMKTSGNQKGLAQLASTLVNSISDSSFSFPIKEETLSIDGTTTYIYENNATFPALYEFLGELLHSKVPIEIKDAKFGPGEIIIAKQHKKEADEDLVTCLKELKELVHAKESKILSKYSNAP